MSLRIRRQLPQPLLVCLCTALVLHVFLLEGLLRAQNSQGTILGHVTDQSGAAVAGAKLTITNLATSVSNTLTTNSIGDYVLVNVVPGNYDIVVEAASGFKRAEARNVRLDVEATVRQNFRLEVGSVSKT